MKKLEKSITIVDIAACAAELRRKRKDLVMPEGIFDTHAHYDDKAFDQDREQILESLAENKICAVVDVGADLKSTQRAVALAQKYPYVYAAAGIHPTETKDCNQEIFQQLTVQAAMPKVVAIGEIGLDYHWDTPRDLQKKWFEKQLYLAVEKDMPVIIHSRDAAEDTFRMLKEAWNYAKQKDKKLSGVIHCFSYEVELAREYVKMGFWLGIGGVVTYKNARKTKQVVKEISLENIVLETDCPYLTPEPHRKERNSSLYLPFVAEEIAAIKEITVQEVIQTTTKNAKRLYRVEIL